MIGQTISHYPALRDPEQRDKIIEKLGEACPAAGQGRHGRGVQSSRHQAQPHGRAQVSADGIYLGFGVVSQIILS